MKEKIKVMQIGGNLRLNGISSSIMEIYRRIHNDFEYVFINTAKGGGPYRAEIEGLGGKVYDVLVEGKGPVRSWRQAKEIRRIIQKERPDVVHSHYFSNNGIYLRQAYLEKVPVRISHCHQSNTDRLRLGKKLALRSSRRLVKKYATMRFGCSDKAREFLYGGQGSVFYSPVDFKKLNHSLDRSGVLKKYDLPDGLAYFAFIGRFVEQKNILFLLEVLKASVDYSSSIALLMVGAGKDEERIHQLVSDLGLSEHVFFMPKESNVEEILFVSECLLLPSLFEGLPIVTLEAQAVGTECLVSHAVPVEAQLGLVTYLPLDKNEWVNEILSRAVKNHGKCPKYSPKFDIELLAPIMANIYRNITSDEWIRQGREYSIGSKRFSRSKTMSHLSFYYAHVLGDPRGTFHLALSLFEGNGVDQDRHRAENLVHNIVDQVEALADKGDPEYLTILGDMYSFGLGKVQSYEKAFECYVRAAENGSLEAQCDLGYMYLVGQGVEKDEEKSTYWWKKSADAGYVHSMRDVGLNYFEGIGTERDYVEACRYFQMASDNNYSHGTSDLAYCYMEGLGVEKDLDKATNLLSLALIQDEERTVRDLIAHRIDVGELRNNNKLVLHNEKRITEVNGNNSYAGTICVNQHIEEIDPHCFYSSSDIRKFFVEKDNPKYAAKGGVLFSKDLSILIRYPPGNGLETYTIPDSVTVIGPHAFQNCRHLSSVTMPESVTSIGASAFDDCKSLRDVNIPQKTHTIGEWCFHGCDRLRRVLIPRNIVSIGRYAFGSCESLKEIVVDDRNSAYCSVDGDLYSKDMRKIIQYAIGKESSSFVVPEPVRAIEFRAFSDAYNLAEVYCSNATLVGEKAFYYATRLEKAVFRHRPFIGKDAFSQTSSNFSLIVEEEQ